MARRTISTETTIIRTIIPGHRFDDGKERNLDTRVKFYADNYNQGSAWRDGTQLYFGHTGEAYEAYKREIRRLTDIASKNIIQGARTEVFLET